MKIEFLKIQLEEELWAAKQFGARFAAVSICVLRCLLCQKRKSARHRLPERRIVGEVKFGCELLST